MYTKILFLIVTTQVVCYTNGMTTKKMDMDSLVYPGLKAQKYIVPEQCVGKKYCNIKPPDYPQEEFNKMFKGYKLVDTPSLVLNITINNRQGDPEDIDNCESTVTYEPLYKVKSTEGDWRTVVQAPEENYIQAIRLETCADTDRSCFTVYPATPDIKTFCKQKYSTWEVLVSNGKGGTEKIKTELPVCCSCHYKSV